MKYNDLLNLYKNLGIKSFCLPYKLQNKKLSRSEILDGMRDFLVGNINVKEDDKITPREILAESMKISLTESTKVDHANFSTSEIIDAIQYHVFQILYLGQDMVFQLFIDFVLMLMIQKHQ